MNNNNGGQYKVMSNVDYNLYIAERLCLIGNRHLMVSSPDPVLTERQLLKINEQIFKFKNGTELQYLICDSKTSVNVFSEILDRDTGSLIPTIQPPGSINNKENVLEIKEHTMYNVERAKRTVLIIRGLERMSVNGQVALLEIIRHRERARKLDDKNVFLIIAIIESIEGNEISLYKYLQEKFWFRHPHVINYHSHNDVFNSTASSSVSSISSDAVILSNESQQNLLNSTDNLLDNILQLRSKISAIEMIPEIRRYMLDIIIFIRNHRIVADGIPTRSIWEFEHLVKCLGLINNYEYIIPVIVKLAARKFFPSRINICDAEDEPSLCWGSDPELIKLMMNKWNVDLVVEDVLNNVYAPI